MGSPELVECIIRDGEDPEAAVDRFIAAADDNGDGVISFVEFAVAAAVDPTLSAIDQTLTAALARVPRDAPAEARGRFGRKPPGERFDSMRMSCLEWEAALGCAPGGDDDEAEECDLAVLEAQEARVDGRLLVVLRGGWAIARCEPVTDALRYAYLEYSSLRLGGDLIFKVLSKVVDGKTKAA
uniref:EF-hand domain-containing protein n=1 Tax=Prymnesium polylepis TaxID=72548 RepID=A0A7S4IXZ4_9EUKA